MRPSPKSALPRKRGPKDSRQNLFEVERLPRLKDILSDSGSPLVRRFAGRQRRSSATLETGVCGVDQEWCRGKAVCGPARPHPPPDHDVHVKCPLGLSAGARCGVEMSFDVTVYSVECAPSSSSGFTGWATAIYSAEVLRRPVLAPRTLLCTFGHAVQSTRLAPVPSVASAVP